MSHASFAPCFSQAILVVLFCYRALVRENEFVPLQLEEMSACLMMKSLRPRSRSRQAQRRYHADKPMSFLVLIDHLAGYYMGARGPFGGLHIFRPRRHVMSAAGTAAA